MQEPIRDDESHEVSFGPDRLSAALRGELRMLVERMVREELVEALGAGRYKRAPERRGYQHSPRERTITTVGAVGEQSLDATVGCPKFKVP